MSISLCMIVKNEEENLPRCLDSVKDIVDEMIIVDTGSTDNTPAIAKSYGAKVYHHEWRNDFSAARNESLRHAACDWILLMDADDEMDREAHKEVLKLVEKDEAEAYFFKTVSYIGDKPGVDTLNNLNLRLLRNGRGYFFSNPIHEQIYSNIIRINPDAKIINLDLKVYHYGYLNKIIKGKDKRKRNIAILEDELKKNPGYVFSLFNLGNEYYAMGNYLKALEYYQQAYDKFDPFQGFSPKLIIKMVNCLINLGRHENALSLAAKGLEYYPGFTELEYFRAMVYVNSMRFTIALRHFEKCIEMGDSPLYFSMVEGVGSYRSYYAMGEIYYRLEDYEMAVKLYEKALNKNSRFNPAYIKLIYAKCMQKTDSTRLERYIDRLNHRLSIDVDNTLLDILIKEKYYELAFKYIKKIEKNSGITDCTLYYKGLCQLMLGKFSQAFSFIKSIDREAEYGSRSLCLAVIAEIKAGMLMPSEETVRRLEENSQDRLVKVYRAFLDCINDRDCGVLSEDEAESAGYSVIIFDLLGILLSLRELPLFEKSLKLLNTISDKTVLLKLAGLYYRESCYRSAYEEIIRSVKIFDLLDFEGAEIMLKLKLRGL